MDFLENLNSQQRQAVTAGRGPVLVLAGPGSGKTRVLTQRAAWLIANQGVRPYQLLAVTFTNKAAREMGDRLRKMLGELPSDGLWLGTFHSICARLLRRESEQLPFDEHFVIYDEDDQQRLVKRCIRDLNLDEKTYRPPAVHAAISRAKNELIFPDTYPIQTYRDEVVKRVYQRYQEALKQNNAVDFDDLLLWTAHLLAEVPAVREKYARRFMHVLVDEFQDTNFAQYVLLKHLASAHHNIFCVGDPDQSIYRWRGADYRNVQRFEQDFPNAQVILLEQNYRSRQTILDAAMGVIDRNPHRRRKNLFSERGPGEKIFYYEALDDYAEAAFVVDTIVSLVSGKVCAAGKCAVMYRTNAQSRLLEEAFLQARLPYRLVGAQRFYGRREVKDMIAFLRLVHNPADEISLERVINLPPRGVGDKTMLALHDAALKAGVSPAVVVMDLARGQESPYWAQFSGRAALPLADFGGLLASWRGMSHHATITELFDRITTDLNIQAYLEDGAEEGVDRWENVQELRRLTVEFEDRPLVEFLENVALISDQDTLSEGKDAPTLLTLHAAKGLEFATVFITGLDDGLLPHSRSFDDPEAMEEERRLFYVGITRAEDRLYLLRALRRGGRGYAEETIPSRYLEDIPSALLAGKTRSGGRPRHATSWQSMDLTRPGATDPRFTASAPLREARFRAGMRVSHATWGEGLVLDSRLQDNDETVDVVFESVGIKRLAASLANLKILN
jgi:DNA helicase-2/ATP-dependent DNA helicase PcrA